MKVLTKIKLKFMFYRLKKSSNKLKKSLIGLKEEVLKTSTSFNNFSKSIKEL